MSLLVKPLISKSEIVPQSHLKYYQNLSPYHIIHRLSKYDLS